MVDVRLILDKKEIQPICLSSNFDMGLSQGAFLMPQTFVDQIHIQSMQSLIFILT